MTRDRRQIQGASAEDRAAKYLRSIGMEILERNVANKLGEIDIVAQDGDTLVFVEVRSRTNPGQVHPAATVNRRKQHQIIRAALAYCQSHRIHDTMIRFDVVVVLGSGETIEHIPNAFESDR